MSRKRRRNRKRKGGPRGPDPAVEINDDEEVEEEEEPFRPKPVPAALVPPEFASEGAFKDAGLECRRCGWRTVKRAFSGTQAMRGHLRRHAYESKSYWRPLKRQAFLVAMIIGLAAITLADVLSTPTWVDVPGDEAMFGVALAAASAVLAVSLILATSAAMETFSRAAVRTARLILAVALIPAIMTAAAPTLIDGDWYWALVPAALSFLTIPASGRIGRSAYLGRRGRWHSSRYYRTMKPRDEESEFEYELWSDRIVRSVRIGKVRPKDLNGAAESVWKRWKRAYERLHRDRSKRRRTPARDSAKTTGQSRHE